MKKMGIGHKKSKQFSFFSTNWKNQFSHGGLLRNKRVGRGQRPLACQEPLHVVFKINATRLRRGSLRSAQEFSLTTQIIKKYTYYFSVKLEQLSIQNDHVHLLIRTTRRSQFQHFFRVVAGQVAQRFEKEGLLSGAIVTGTPKTGTSLWKYRPFSRVVRGWRAYKIIRNYIQLNKQEVKGKIRYQKLRLRGLSSSDWEILWS